MHLFNPGDPHSTPNQPISNFQKLAGNMPPYWILKYRPLQFEDTSPDNWPVFLMRHPYDVLLQFDDKAWENDNNCVWRVAYSRGFDPEEVATWHDGEIIPSDYSMPMIVSRGPLTTTEMLKKYSEWWPWPLQDWSSWALVRNSYGWHLVEGAQYHLWYMLGGPQWQIPSVSLYNLSDPETGEPTTWNLQSGGPGDPSYFSGVFPNKFLYINSTVFTPSVFFYCDLNAPVVEIEPFWP